jgi:hypothetical protein
MSDKVIENDGRIAGARKEVQVDVDFEVLHKY